MIPLLLSAAGGFLLGSLPTGYLAGKARGIDIRQHGSGNIGATNVFRTLGRPLGILVFLVDAGKGLLAVRLAMLLEPAGGDAALWCGITAAVACIAGHNFTPWLGFRGGKGIATSAGVLLALAPLAVVLTGVVWWGVFSLSRYVSLASITAAAALPVIVGLLWWQGLGGGLPLFVFTVVIGSLAILRHRSNIRRLREGTESRFVKRKD